VESGLVTDLGFAPSVTTTTSTARAGVVGVVFPHHHPRQQVIALSRGYMIFTTGIFNFAWVQSANPIIDNGLDLASEHLVSLLEPPISVERQPPDGDHAVDGNEQLAHAVGLKQLVIASVERHGRGR